ncbi:importin subunit beta-3 [Botryosphaeria dothidea]|uniref:HEAT domain-containing protein n=1 Tax=Botryosphaeria dothidea TaxID=55169 RepID=A0A8H4N2M4_9PEZI|nr:HEAT domain-containing protein [Botryosphaeria dothidea]
MSGSVLPPEIHSALAQLLAGLQSPDNVQRTQTEETLNTEWVIGRPDVLLMGLSEQIHLAEDPSTRSFASVLFRRIATRSRKDPTTDQTKELFLTLPQPQRNAIREKLLQCLEGEQNTQVRNKVGDAIAEIARQYTEEGTVPVPGFRVAEPAINGGYIIGEPWPELLGALFKASQSAEHGQRESAFRIFATTPGIIEKQHEDTVLGAFTNGFKDDNIMVRIAAMEAFASFFRSINKKSQQKYYPLIAEILNILPPIKEAGDSDQLSKALVSLIDLAEIAPKMFKPVFNALVNFSITVIQDKELDDQARQNALELMATFADCSPQMCRKDTNYTPDMVTQCLSLMTDVGIDDDDAAEWNAQEDLDVDESDQNHVAGEQCMDRLANKLGGGAILPPTFNWLPRMMTSSAWRDRHAALMAISAISEGCRDMMVGELDKVLDLVVPALQDQHPRVRWAGCNALGQMSTDFAGTMQEKYHQVVLSNIIPVLQSAEPRVQAHAAAALVNFCEEAEKEVLEPYLDTLLTNLLQLLQSPKRFVQEQALSTIATVADSAEVAFSKYYDTLMPLLFNVLREEQSKEYRLLRAKAMECATLIALAVGKEKMGQDAIALVNLLGTIQQSITDVDDPQGSYLLHCWGRMCRVLGQDFLPYLPAVIPPLTELAGAKADIQLLDDDEQVAQVEQEDGWELVPLKGKVIGIKTSTLDDKHMAIELIVIYAQVLEGAFEPYVNEIMDKIAIPGLAFFFHDPVRVASAKCVPQLLNSYKKAHGEQSPQLGQLWARTVEKVLEVLSTEPAIDTLAEMYQCFYECVEILGKSCLTDQHMAAFIDAAKSVLEEYKERVKARLEEQADNDEGEELSEEVAFAIEDDQTLLSDMNKAFHVIFQMMGPAFLPHWERLLEFYTNFVTNPDPTQRQWAICIFDDVLEFCGPQSWNYQQYIINPIVNGMRDDVAANRQAAVYGVGVAAQKGGEAWSDFVNNCLPILFEVIARPNARDDDDVFATENACASIAKILHYNSSKVPNVQEVVNAWADTLPIVNDEEAAPYAYAFLAQLIDQNNPAVLAKAPQCFTNVALALEAETLQGNIASTVVRATKQLVQNAGLDANQLLSGLTPEAQHTVRAYFG